MISVTLQNASPRPLPSEETFCQWVSAALRGADLGGEREICIRIVESEESRTLNRQFRQQDKATNVLSFPCELPLDVNLPLMGDLVICADVVIQEAMKQHKTTEAHFAHMTVHGTLHLAGYDHVDDADAERMEALEITVLNALGYENPYRHSA